MPINSETKFEDYFNLPNPGLRSYFEVVRQGQPDEYRTTFARGSSVQKVLQDWEPNISCLSEVWPTLVEFENDLRSKVGPLSIMKPLKERMDDIDHYYEDILLPHEPISLDAIDAVLAEWRTAKGIPLRTQSKTVEKMKKSTNSGSPYFTKRSSVVDKSVPASALIVGNAVEQILPNSEWYAAAVLGWRGQEGGSEADDVKQRVVWMFPFAINVKELQFYQPLIEVAQNLNLVPAWNGLEHVDLSITKLFDTKGEDDLIVCTDFTRFDQHFNEACQEAAETLLYNVSDRSASMDKWIKHVFPIKYVIPLAYDWRKLRFGKHGMGSGSGGTNADETLVHRALQYEVAQSVNQKLNPNSQCLGDDGILTYPGINVEDVVRVYTSHGLEMNTDKQYASKQDCVYLRRWHHRDYRKNGIAVGVYSTYRALGRLCEQERYYDPDVWSREMVALRQLSIIENTKWHPQFVKFVKFCMERDKYRLGIDIPGFLDDIEVYAKKATDYMPDFLGYSRSLGSSSDLGIQHWGVVQLLKKFK